MRPALRTGPYLASAAGAGAWRLRADGLSAAARATVPTFEAFGEGSCRTLNQRRCHCVQGMRQLNAASLQRMERTIMKRQIWKLSAATALGAFLLAGCSSGGTAPPASSTVAGSQPSVALKTGQAALGTIVVNGQGMTAYVFDKDTANSGTSACTGPCIALWPAITSPTASPQVNGVTGKVATIALPNGTRQVTVNGLPLYTYTPDTKPGEDAGQGYGGIWWVVGPDGNKVAATPAPATSGSSGQGY